MKKVEVSFIYLQNPYYLEFESTVILNEEGKLDDLSAEMLVSVVLGNANVQSKKVCVHTVVIKSENKVVYCKEELCFFHIGKQLY